MAPTPPNPPRAAAPPPPLPLSITPHKLTLNPRQLPTDETTTTIPAHYGSLHSGPDPGTVAGITLGAVAGFVLLLWLLYTCINMGNPSAGSGSNDTSTVVTEGTASVYTRRRRRSSKGVGHKETVEVRRRGSVGGRPVVVEEMSSVGGSEVDRVVIEETRRRSVSRPRYAHAQVPRTPRRVPSSDSGGEEDEVVVIEEHSPPRARRQRSRVRSVERRSSGYREVDPERFAGGDASFVEVRRSGSRR